LLLLEIFYRFIESKSAPEIQVHFCPQLFTTAVIYYCGLSRRAQMTVLGRRRMVWQER
jgi:hypothetical protein